MPQAQETIDQAIDRMLKMEAAEADAGEKRKKLDAAIAKDKQVSGTKQQQLDRILDGMFGAVGGQPKIHSKQQATPSGRISPPPMKPAQTTIIDRSPTGKLRERPISPRQPRFIKGEDYERHYAPKPKVGGAGSVGYTGGGVPHIADFPTEGFRQTSFGRTVTGVEDVAGGVAGFAKGIGEVAYNAAIGRQQPAAEQLWGMLGEPQLNEWRKARDLMQARGYKDPRAAIGSDPEIAAHFTAALVPLAGPMAAHAGERMGSGDIEGGLVEAMALLAPEALKLGKAPRGLEPIPKRAPDAPSAKAAPVTLKLSEQRTIPNPLTDDPMPTTYKYHLHQEGKQVGYLDVEISPDGKTANVDWVGREPKGSPGVGSGANTLGSKAMREALREFRREHPEVERITADRISGGRSTKGGGVESQELSLKLPKVPKTKARLSPTEAQEIAETGRDPYFQPDQPDPELATKEPAWRTAGRGKLPPVPRVEQTAKAAAPAAESVKTVPGKSTEGITTLNRDTGTVEVNEARVRELKAKGHTDEQIQGLVTEGARHENYHAKIEKLDQQTLADVAKWGDSLGTSTGKRIADAARRGEQPFGSDQMEHRFIEEFYGNKPVESKLPPPPSRTTGLAEDRMQQQRREWIDRERQTNPNFAPDVESAKELLTPEQRAEVARYEELRYRAVAMQGPEKGYKPYKLTKAERAELADLDQKYGKLYRQPREGLTPPPKAEPFEMPPAERASVARATEKFSAEPKVKPSAKVEQTIPQRLESAANEARARLKAKAERVKKGELKEFGSGGLSSEDIRDYAIIGAEKLLKTGMEFSKWAAEMVSELGDSIKPHLNEIWARAQGEHQRLREPLPGQKTRSLPETLDEHGMIGGEERHYDPAPNVRSLDRATEVASGVLAEKGPDGTLEWLRQSTAVGPEQTAVGMQLIDQLQDRALAALDHDPAAANKLMAQAQEAAEIMSVRLTRYGQAVQAVQVVEKLHPSRVLTTAQKVYEDAHPGGKLPTEKATQISQAAREVQRAKQKAREFQRMANSSADPRWQELIRENEDAMLVARKKLARHMQSLDKRAKVEHAIGSAIGALRSIKTAFDLSAPGRQGWIGAVTHPIRGLIVPFWEQLRALDKIPDAHTAWGKFQADKLGLSDYKSFEDDILLDPVAQEMKQLGYEAFTRAGPHVPTGLREEYFQSDLAAKIPGVARSEQAFSTFRNVQAKELYKIYRDWLGTLERLKLIKPEDMVREKQGILKFIADEVGRGSLSEGKGRLGKMALATEKSPLVTQGLFAYRWMKSRFNLMNPAYYTKLPQGARLVAAMEMTRFVGSVGAMLYLAQRAGAEVSTDPNSADFLKVKVGNTRYDISGGFQNETRFLFRFLGAIKDQQTGFMTRKVGSPTGWVDQDGKVRQSAGDIWTRFWRSKLAPVPAVAADIATGETLEYDQQTGKPLPPSLGTEGSELVEPLVEKDLREAWQLDGIGGLGKALPSIVGIGVQTYGPKPPAKRRSGLPGLPRLPR